MKILVLNGGSSSFKSSLYDVTGKEASGPAPQPLWDGRVNWEHHAGVAEIQVTAGGSVTKRTVNVKAPIDSLGPLMEMLPDRGEIAAAGHRVVHGGRAYRDSTRITPEVRKGIAQMASFAPEHNRLELEAMDSMDRLLGPNAVQVAVFDTAFHASLPAPAYVYPG